MAPIRTVNSFDLYIRKSVESILSLVPRHKGLHIALIVETSTLKAPRQCKYIASTIDNERQYRSKPMRAVYNTPHETFPLLCF